MKITTGSAAFLAMPFNAGKLMERKMLLNAYYFRAHMYTMVPSQVNEDLKWMKDCGTDIVSIAILEQDLFAAKENIEIICNEAFKLGIKVFAVPSRWGGMIAGAPKVPSIFSIQNPQTWMVKEDGSYYSSAVSGRISSVHYPEVFEFFCSSLEELFKIGDIKGVVWDEPKTLRKDFSRKAIESLGKDATYKDHFEANRDFYSRVNQYVKTISDDIVTNMFIYPQTGKAHAEILSRITHLDYFGCDGRPWYPYDGGVNESEGKTLLGPGKKFLELANAQGKGSLWLIENHNMKDEDAELMDKRFPEVLSCTPNQLIYYYYPRNLESPDMIMNIMKKHLIKIK